MHLQAESHATDNRDLGLSPNAVMQRHILVSLLAWGYAWCG